MEEAGKTVLVLGAGIGGIVLSSLLRKGLDKAHRIILFDQELNHSFQPSYLWVMTGDRSSESISRPFTDLKQDGIEFVQGIVKNISTQEKRVTLADGRQFSGDYVVVALGADLVPEIIPGLKGAGHNLYTLEGVEAIRDARLQLQSGRIAVVVAGLPYKCPASPCEAAMILEHDCMDRKIRDQVQIDLYTPESGPMPVTGEQMSNQVRQMMESKGIVYHSGHSILSVNEKLKQITFQNGIVADFDLLIYVPPHRAPLCVIDGGLVNSLGWISVDRFTLETRFPGIFAIGDINSIPLAIGKPLPKAGVFAYAQAKTSPKDYT
jgi:sulfide:quinone oxidoreductase